MVSSAKDLIRKKMLAKRDMLTTTEVRKLSESIMQKLLNHERFAEAKCIALYVEKGNEVSTMFLRQALVKLNGKEIALPVTDGHHLAFYHFEKSTGLKPGNFGILEPAAKAPLVHEPSIIIVPGVAFGLCMHRLGYGKGYYDRYLAESAAYRIGVCYDFQVVERLPSHENDQRMDEILTDKRIIK